MKMKLTPLRVVGGLFVLGAFGVGVAYGATALFGNLGGDPRAELSVPITPELVQRGKYVAEEGDCAACHTAPGGRPFSGGLAIATPMGAVYTTNITPDHATGIGRYSYGDFERAVRRGILPNGDALLPAMPFPSYARISDADLQALYIYFRQGVQSASQANRPEDIPWPLSMRWPLTYWRWLFAPAVQSTQAMTSDDPAVDRGAYLVESLGHCGACHTPRGPALEEKVLTNGQGSAYLSGGFVDSYVASDLRGDSMTGLGRWSEDDIVAFLKTGRNHATAAFGGMSQVIEDSTQYMTDADLHAIARYLKSLPATQQTQFTYDATQAKALAAGNVSATGAIDYLNNCAACHLSSGKGYVLTFPALAGNPVVNAANPSSLINIILYGGTELATRLAPTHFTMPPFGDRLSDQEIADVVTFIRSSWGNNAPPVAATDVAKIRAVPHAPISPYPEGDPRLADWQASQAKPEMPDSPLQGGASTSQSPASPATSRSQQ
jgi:mono/diheme cytochrome c family protein